MPRVFVAPVVALLAFALTSGAAQPAAAVAVPGDSCRAVPVDADGPLRSAAARAAFGVDGSGVTVGVLSDSFGALDSTIRVQRDIDLGALPGPGNPCGRDVPVEVLSDDPLGHDEGRAMLQVVHGIAPGARLVFATTGPDSESTARGILALAEAGADVIVDDVGMPSEPVYQQGVISAAIAQVREEHGVAYYTSAGNDGAIGAAGTRSAGLPISAWETDAYRGAACPDDVVVPEGFQDVTCLDFDPGPGVDTSDRFAVSKGIAFMLSWAEPVHGVTSRFQAQTYRVHGSSRSIMDRSRGVDPSVPNEIVSVPPIEGEFELVIVRDGATATGTPALWIGTRGDPRSLLWREYDRSNGGDRVGRSLHGHAADGSSVSVAAANWKTPLTPRSFTSVGPGELRFAPVIPGSTVPSPALPERLVVDQPSIAGVDGVETTFFGDEVWEDGQRVMRFVGTSAAAPAVAAVHALATEYVGGGRADEITAAMMATAQPMDNPFAGIVPEGDVFGAGLADATALLNALPAPSPTPTPSPTLVPTPAPSPSSSAAPAATLPDTGAGADHALAVAGALLVAGGLALFLFRRPRRS